MQDSIGSYSRTSHLYPLREFIRITRVWLCEIIIHEHNIARYKSKRRYESQVKAGKFIAMNIKLRSLLIPRILTCSVVSWPTSMQYWN